MNPPLNSQPYYQIAMPLGAQIMVNSLALFLGAGFSKWSANLPLVSELFDFEIEPTSNREATSLKRIRQDWERWTGSTDYITPEQFIHWAINKSSQSRSTVIWYISRRLSEPFMSKIRGGYSTLMFDETRAKTHLGVLKAHTLLSQIQRMGLTGILTCNYDTLIECALGTSGFNYGVLNEQLSGRGHNPTFPHMFSNRSVTGNIRVAKLHGSLSWTENEKFTSGKPGRAGQALIVPPAPEKITPAELHPVWDLGGSVLRDSKSLIVFGFAFNPYDKALRDFLQSNGGALKRVLLIDPYPNVQAATTLWPQANVSTISPTDTLFDDLLEWERQT